MTRQVSPLALLVLALMALALAVLWLAPGVPAGWRHWQAPAPQAPKLDDVQAAARQFNPAAVAVYPAVLERPLMSPARRPPAPASAAVAAPGAPPPTAIEQVRMQGIVAGPTLTGVFLEEDGRARFVRRGEKVGDWTLDSVQGRDIVFQRGTELRRIELLPTPGPDQGPGSAKPAPTAAAGQRASPPAAPTPRPAPPQSAPRPPAPPAAAPARVPGSSSGGSFGGGRRSPPAADAAPR